MQNLQTSTCSEQKYTYNVLDSITAVFEVEQNPFDLPLDCLFKMAARKNKKRSFLFVSELLGKHLPIDPKKGLLTGEMLAAVYMQTVKGIEIANRSEIRISLLNDEPSLFGMKYSGHPLIIGFAETATALANAFFAAFPDADFVHTTRENPKGFQTVISFEEEHSHATAHRCYIPVNLIANEREIILVDDELTTGKTAINIIRSIQSQYPRKEYTVVTILDWRSQNHKLTFEELEKELGITIKVASILSGVFEVKQHKALEENYSSITASSAFNQQVEYVNMSEFTEKMHANVSDFKEAPYIKETGRFALSGEESAALCDTIKKAGLMLSQKRESKKTLCLGTGEFMYIPMKIAAEMGDGVKYHSTTRSPIYVKDEAGYGARNGFSFPNPEDDQVEHFLYNISPGQYDDIFLFFEREVSATKLEPLLQQMRKTLAKSIKIVFFAQNRGETHE